MQPASTWAALCDRQNDVQMQPRMFNETIGFIDRVKMMEGKSYAILSPSRLIKLIII